uniref:Uncharacterized protein n=1 Tax=viral metagenome TaxID=1070528 RepID=A0A6C0DIM3_9ZZZZ
MKYIIEGDIDFYKELLDSSYENEIIDADNNCCMITNMPLQENFVKLQCGHLFNYGPLFKDLLNYKKKFNNMEQSKYKLKYNEIRCPYCRKIQNELLPYYDNLSYPKECGVNYLDPNKSNYILECINEKNQCKYEHVMFDDSGNVLFTQKCFKYGFTHSILKEKYNLNINYCYSHKQFIMKELKEKAKEKIKQDKEKIKQEKLKIKEDLIKAAMEKKNLEKEMKKNAVVKIDETKIAENAITCSEIVKSGQRKGLSCLTKVYKDCLCKRHYNITNKDINIS